MGDLERAALRDAVRRLIDANPGAGPWKRLCGEIGVAGLAIPERYGGLGAGLREAHVVLEELGRTLTTTPMLGSVVAAHALLGTGDDATCRRLLPDIAAGRVAALAWTGISGKPSDVACTVDADGRLYGEAHHVLDGDAADLLLVAARRNGGTGLYEVDGLANCRAVPTMDETRRLATVTLDGVPGRLLGAGDPLPALRDVACVALSAEQAGATARALELTVAYTKTRVQFGRPIGSFQAIQHRLADLRVLADSTRSVSYAAAAALDAGAPDAGRLAVAAKVACSEAFERVAAEMIQLHGGIGITWEHDAHRYFKRAHGSAYLFGHPRDHVRRLASEILDVQARKTGP